MEVPCSAIAATLSNYRTDIELSSFLGIAYSTTISWSNEDNYKSEKKFQMYLLEYFRRLNTTAMKEVSKNYDLKSDNDADFISEIFIPEKEVNSFLVSRVAWKRQAIEMLLETNKELFAKQVEMIKLFVAANEEPRDIKVLLRDASTVNSLPLGVINANVEHLKIV